MKITAILLIICFLFAIFKHRNRIKKEDKVNNLKRYYPDKKVEDK